MDQELHQARGRSWCIDPLFYCRNFCSTSAMFASVAPKYRWARSLKFLVNNLAELTAYGVAFVSLRDNIDLSTPAGRLMVQMIGAFAEFERSLIVERVRAGMSSARARGKRLGRPSSGITVEQMVALRGSGASWRTVGEKLGVDAATALRLY